MTTIDTLEQLQNKVKDFSLTILEKEGFIKDLDYDTNILYNYFNDFDFELEDFEYKGNGEYVDREGYYYSLQDAIEEKYNNICFYDFIIQPLKELVEENKISCYTISLNDDCIDRYFYKDSELTEKQRWSLYETIKGSVETDDMNDEDIEELISDLEYTLEMRQFRFNYKDYYEYELYYLDLEQLIEMGGGIDSNDYQWSEDDRDSLIEAVKIRYLDN